MKILAAGEMSYFDMPHFNPPMSLAEYVMWLKRQHRMTPAVAEAVERAQRIQKEFPVIGYCAGALTEASAEDKLRYEYTHEIAGKQSIFLYVPHLFGTDPQKHPNVTPPEVRDINYLWSVVMAQFHVNFLWPIAHGNGIEQGWAESAGIPTVYCVPSQMRLSRMPRGMVNIDATILYQDIANAYQELGALFELIGGYMRDTLPLWQKPDLRKFFIRRKYERGEIVDPILEAISVLEAKIHHPTVAVITETLQELGICLDEDDLVAVFNCLIQNNKIYLAGFVQENGLFSRFLNPYFLVRGDNDPHDGVELYPREEFKRLRTAWAHINAPEGYYTASAIWKRADGAGLSLEDTRFAATLQDILRNGGMGIGFTLEDNIFVPCFYFEC